MSVLRTAQKRTVGEGEKKREGRSKKVSYSVEKKKKKKKTICERERPLESGET